MATAVPPLPIYYTPDVHTFYQKQKTEFHFTQKTDNDFLMFLLDTAVRVISIVQHLAPVIEAVSDAGAEVDELEDEMSPAENNVSTGAMDIDDISTTLTPLSAELEQINQEITNAQISSQQIPRPRRTITAPSTSYMTPSTSYMTPSTSYTTPSITTAAVSEPITIAPSPVTQPPPPPPQAIVPTVQLPSSAQSSENLPTTLPSVTQPVAEPPAPPTDETPDHVKTEQPVPEVIEIKEEDPGSSNELLSQDTLQQLMSSISGTEDTAGLPNFVPTAMPSSLPPSFLDRGAGNPLSMLGSLNTGDGAGPSGINVPNISESMMKNINDAGLNVSSVKGQANPISVYTIHNLPSPRPKEVRKYACVLCSKTFYRRHHLENHHRTHTGERPFVCEFCGKRFGDSSNYRKHIKQPHLNTKFKLTTSQFCG